ncbi:MAG: poly-gamma-glutamate biosynthesis protein PgsC/CapC [Planctomycetota bacterium]
MNSAEFMSVDLIRFAFVLGMILSVYLYEKSHLTTGSIVVPGFLAIHIFEPWVILFTVLNAAVCFWLIHVLLPRFVLMQNSHKFYLLIVASVLIHIFWRSLAVSNYGMSFAANALMGFGYVIPGLIAHDMSRNGCLRTSVNVLFATHAIGIVLYFSVVVFPRGSLNLQEIESFEYAFELPFILALSTFGAIVLKSQTPIRSGGYITAAYVVFLGTSELTLVSILMAAVVTYWINVWLIMPNMIVFGRRKFSAMLIVGSLVMWAFCILVEGLGIGSPVLSHPAYAGIIMLLPGLIANDMQRASLNRVIAGLGILSGWVFAVASLIYELRYFSRPDQIVPLAGISIVLLLIIFLFTESEKQHSKHRLPAVDGHV